MEPLRAPTFLTNAAVVVTITGDEYGCSHRVRDVQDQFTNVGMKVRLPKDTTITTVDLSGRTLCDAVAIHQGLSRVAKSAAKDNVNIGFTYTGDLTAHDLGALSNEYTPGEDLAIVKKLSKWASLTAAQWLRAFELVGLDVTPVKDGRKVVGFTIAFPDTDPVSLPLAYGVLYANRHHDDSETMVAQVQAAKEWLVSAAHTLLGKELRIEDGRPARARDYRTDLTIRTCPCCFRDIKASGHTSGKMADHGYEIRGRDYGSWGYGGGYRSGGCAGVGELPWEKSPEPVKGVISELSGRSKFLEGYLSDLKGGKVLTLIVKEGWGENQRVVTLTPDHGYKWTSALNGRIQEVESELRSLWNGFYGSIPWYRMALRTWQPVPDDHIAVGAPKTKPESIDFDGSPAI